MENLYMIEATFVDGRTILLSEEYPYETKDVRLIIIPVKKPKVTRTAGFLKGKIRMAEDFNAPLDDLKAYME